MSNKDKNSFDIGQWCDYVRGMLDEETETAMRRRLDESGSDRRRVRAFQQVLDVAGQDLRQAPPEWAVRGAKAIGRLSRPEDGRQPSLLRRLVMSLSFDSLAGPALAGTRDAQAQDRQLVFSAEGYRVDLRVEPEADFQTAVLVGQLMKTRGGLTPAVDVPVFAVKDGQVVAQARSGPFGEFQSEGLPASGVQLCLLPERDFCLQIELGHNGSDGNHPGESA